MKEKKLVLLVLLLVMSFSLVHEFAFAYFDDDHCTTSEYIAELEGPTEHGDICDVHYEHHITYILTSIDIKFDSIHKSINKHSENTSYLFKTYSKTIKPPIV